MTRIRYYLIALIFVFAVLPAHVIAGKPYLKHAIGDTITAEEADLYSLFADQPEFTQAWILPSSKSSAKLLIIESSDGIDTLQQEILFDNDILDVLPAVLMRADSLRVGLEISPGVPVTVIPQTGVSIHGFIMEWTGTHLVVRTQFGVSRIPIDHVDGISTRVSNQIVNDVITYSDPNRTRLFFMPTGRSLKKGEGYFAAYEVLLPSVQVGIGYNISIGGGIFPIFNEDFFLGWLTGQIGLVETETYSLSVGSIATFITSDEVHNAGIYYGVGSYGSPDASVSLGMGLGFEDGTTLSDEPFMVLGGEYRMSRSTKLITENWMIPETGTPVVSIGMRWFGERLAADFALFRPLDEAFLGIGIPWVDFVVHF